jgi:hypothetical protein
MLDRRASQFDEELPCGGVWSRLELEEMDLQFCRALEVAFERGLERRASATATVRAKSRLVDQEAVIQRMWEWHTRNRDAEVPFMEIVGRIRALLPTITAERVRLGFEARRRSGASSA